MTPGLLADGFSRQVFLINGQTPGPLIEVDEGDELEVFVKNNLAVEMAIHWHGILQRGTPEMDGTIGVTQDPIQPGGNFTYRMHLEGEYGFYWYHAHSRAYSDDGIRGPLTIRPSPQRPKPYKHLADDEQDFATMQNAEREAVPLLLSDWYHRVSDDVYNDYISTGMYPNNVDSLLANGQGQVQCLPQPESGMSMGSSSMNMSAASPTTSMAEGMTMNSGSPMTTDTMATEMASMDNMRRRAMEGSSMADMCMSMASTTTAAASAAAMSPMASSTCTNMTAPLLAINANYTRGWLALNMVNGGSITKLSVSLDSHSMHVYAADGFYVKPQEVQRYSVMVKLDQMPGNYTLRFASYPYGSDMQQVIEGQATIVYQGDTGMAMPMNMTSHVSAPWMLSNGSATSNATLLSEQDLVLAEPASPPCHADITYNFFINQTDATTWALNGTPYQTTQVPLLYSNTSDGWNASTTLHVPLNSTVDIILQIANDSMDAVSLAQTRPLAYLSCMNSS
ncbi:Laccase abr2 [Lasiodiplodia hormozganensis]|uniref:Laccase abr2 n=1 Tax=Lasiodiplodia hormozganensis TaxID=869390 RepID=A0AA39WHL9_9PEZI|nr:Laccase abr2 [Lasiodiplodia hormozganensis]